MAEGLKNEPDFWPVGLLENPQQLVAELKIAGDRLSLKGELEWAKRFYALAGSLEEVLKQNQNHKIEVDGPPCPTCGFKIVKKEPEPFIFRDAD